MNRFGLTLVLVTAWLSFAASTRAENPVAPPSFNRDMLPLLTKHGCNQGACHGIRAAKNRN